MTISDLLKRTLVLGSLWAVIIAVIGGAIGAFAAGMPGFLGAVVGAIVAAVFLGLTALSVIVAVRASSGDMLRPAFFAIVLGGWMLKFIVFLVALLLLRDAPWLNPVAFFFAVVAAVVGSLAIDVYVMSKSRMPYVDVALPNSADGADSAPRA